MSKFHKRHTKIGARPGTLVIPKNAAKPVVRVMHYDAGKLEEREIEDVRELSSRLSEPGVWWVDLCGLGDEDVLRGLGDAFGLHSLALEAVVNVPQRPNVQTYDSHLLLITRMVMFKAIDVLDVEQVSVFVGPNYVLTVQERFGDVFEPVRQRIRRGGGPMRKHGASYLAYALLDTVIDAYFPVLEQIGDALEDLEADVLERPASGCLRRIYHLKRELLTLRRSIWPQREMINGLLRDESEFIGDAARLYLRDTYDHCVQLIDGTETYRELAGGLMDLYLSSVANRQNDVMKVLTIMASIFIPLTFLAGIYGMNFQHMPELHSRWGYPILLGIMAATTLGMLAYFRRRGWINSGD